MGDVVIAGLWGLVGAARAGVIAVPGDAPDLATAAALAYDGDVIELSAGSWIGPGPVEVSVTIIGVDGRDVTTITDGRSVYDQAMFEAWGGSLALQGLTLDLSAASRVGTGVLAYGAVTLSDVKVIHSTDYLYDIAEPAVVGSGGDLHLQDVLFYGGLVQGSSLVSAGGDVILERVELNTHFFDEYAAAAIDVQGGSFVAMDLLFTSAPVRPQLRVSGATTAHLARVRSCSFQHFEIAAERIEIEAVQLEDDTYPASLSLTGSATVRNSVLGDAILANGSLAVWSSVLRYAATIEGGVALSGGYNLFEGVAVPDGLSAGAIVTGDAGLVELVDDSDEADGYGCGILAPAAGSPAIDAGDPTSFDRNGTRADIGVTGGPEGFVVDADGDGWLSDVDCADADPAIHPGAQDAPYDGVDQDCSGGDLVDVDGDGVAIWEDCDDRDPGIAPGRDDPPGDGIDQDCDGFDGPSGTVPGDADGDGFAAGEDCDDADPSVFPGAAEDLGPVDRDCDGWSDPAEAFRPRGCGVPGGGSPGVVPLVLLVLALRRREP